MMRNKRIIALSMSAILLAGCGGSSAIDTESSVSSEVATSESGSTAASSSTVATVSESVLDDLEKVDNEDPAVEETDAAEDVSTSDELSSETTISQELTEEETKLTSKQENAINMLNYLTGITAEIANSDNSKLSLEDAYFSILDNANPNAIDDRTLGELNGLLDTLEGYRMIKVKRERLEYIYEQNQAQALRSAIPNPIGLLSSVKSKSIPELVGSIAYMAIDSVASYQSASASADLEYLQGGWQLDDQQEEFLHKQRKDMFSYMVKTVNENQLDTESALTEETLKAFVDCKNSSNNTSRIRFLESNKETYKTFGDYWLTLAKSYYSQGAYEKCIEAVSEYEALGINIFRRDYDFAETLPIAIAAASVIYDGNTYVSVMVFVLIIVTDTNVYAHNNQAEHWEELEQMLFNSKSYRVSAQEKEKTAIEIIEYAETLCIDQFGETNGILLEGLKKWKVKGIPKNVSALNPPEGSTKLSPKNHRNYTHQGWEYDYSKEPQGDLANWSVRKNLLLASVEKVFNFTPLDGKFFVIDLGYSEKCDSFSALVYYVHILGDYLEDDNVAKFNGTSNGHKIPFAANRSNPTDMFSELEKHIKVLFSEQSNSRTYSSLISDIETLATKSRRIASDSNGQITEANFRDIKKCVVELMDLLTGDNKSGKGYANAIHTLLMKEEFFTKVFYPELISEAA